MRRHTALLLLVVAALIVLRCSKFRATVVVTIVLPALLTRLRCSIQSAVRLPPVVIRSCLFVALGAYGAAVLTSKLGIKSFEVILLVSGLAAVAIAVPVGLLAVRYVRIFFGILTLAFGMLFHSFLFKFYDITGGDTGIRVLRPALFGNAFEDLDKTAFLIGPFYYYCLVLLVVLGFVCGASCIRRLDCT